MKVHYEEFHFDPEEWIKGDQSVGLVVEESIDPQDDIYRSIAQKTIRESVNKAFAKMKPMKPPAFKSKSLFASAPPEFETGKSDSRRGIELLKVKEIVKPLEAPVIDYEELEEENEAENGFYAGEPLVAPNIKYPDLKISYSLPPPVIKYPDSMEPSELRRVDTLPPPPVFYDMFDFSAALAPPTFEEPEIEVVDLPPPPLEYDALDFETSETRQDESEEEEVDPLGRYEQLRTSSILNGRNSAAGFRSSLRASVVVKSLLSSVVDPTQSLVIEEPRPSVVNEKPRQSAIGEKPRQSAAAPGELRAPRIQPVKILHSNFDYAPHNNIIRQSLVIPPPPLGYSLNPNGELIPEFLDPAPLLEPPAITYELIEADETDLVEEDQGSILLPPRIDAPFSSASKVDLLPPQIDYSPLFDIQTEPPVSLLPPPPPPTRLLKPPPIIYNAEGTPVFSGLQRFSKRSIFPSELREGELLQLNGLDSTLSQSNVLLEPPVIDYHPMPDLAEEDPELVIYSDTEIDIEEKHTDLVPPKIDYAPLNRMNLEKFKYLPKEIQLKIARAMETGEFSAIMNGQAPQARITLNANPNNTYLDHIEVLKDTHQEPLTDDNNEPDGHRNTRITINAPIPPNVDPAWYDALIKANQDKGEDPEDFASKKTRITINTPIPPNVDPAWYDALIKAHEQENENKEDYQSRKTRITINAPIPPNVDPAWYDALIKANQDKGEDPEDFASKKTRITINTPIPPNVDPAWYDALIKSNEEKRASVLKPPSIFNEEVVFSEEMQRDMASNTESLVLPLTSPALIEEKLIFTPEMAAQLEAQKDYRLQEELAPCPIVIDEGLEFTPEMVAQLETQKDYRLQEELAPCPIVVDEGLHFSPEMASQLESQKDYRLQEELAPCPIVVDEGLEFTPEMVSQLETQKDYRLQEELAPCPLVIDEGLEFSPEMVAQIASHKNSTLQDELEPPVIDYTDFDGQMNKSSSRVLGRTTKTLPANNERPSAKFCLSYPERLESSQMQFELLGENSSIPGISAASILSVAEQKSTNLRQTQPSLEPMTLESPLLPPPNIEYEFEDIIMELADLPPPSSIDYFSIGRTLLPPPEIHYYDLEIQGLLPPSILYDTCTEPLDFKPQDGDLPPPAVQYAALDVPPPPPLAFDIVPQHNLLPPLLESEYPTDLLPPPLSYDDKFRISKVDKNLLAKILQMQTEARLNPSDKQKKHIVIKDHIIEENLLKMAKENPAKILSFPDMPNKQVMSPQLEQLARLNNDAVLRRVSCNLTDTLFKQRKSKRESNTAKPESTSQLISQSTDPQPTPSTQKPFAPSSFKKDLRPTCMRGFDPEIYELEYKMRMMEKMNEVFSKSKIDKATSCAELKQVHSKLVSKKFIEYMASLPPQSLYYVEKLQERIRERTNRKILEKIKYQERKTIDFKNRISQLPKKSPISSKI